MGDDVSSISIAGKEIFIIPNENDEDYTYQDLVNHLRKYNVFESLNRIGKKSFELSGSSNPMANYILAYLSMVLIRHSNDFRGHKLDEQGLFSAVKIYTNLKDPLHDDGDGVAYLLRYGSISWDFVRPSEYIIPRTYLLYSRLWDECDKTTIDVKDGIQNLTGLNLECLFYMACAFYSKSKNGHFLKYRDSKCTMFNDKNQDLFLNYASCDYAKFRSECKPIRSGYEKYSFNPLLKYPLIVPEKRPYELNCKPYLVPVPGLLLYRVTHGLFFDLADLYRDKGKANPFRSSFGYVFQDYIGELLKRCGPEGQLLPEFRYHKTKDSPDWLILNGEKLVVIEVKYPMLYLDAKQFGDDKKVKKDLKNTIGKAVKQFYQFGTAITSCSDSKLGKFKGCKVQRLIVTYDRGYFLNSFIKDYLKDIFEEEVRLIPDNFEFQVISVDEFEYLVGEYGDDLFSFLEEKNSNKEHREMDFNEYLNIKTNIYRFRNKFLDDLRNELLSTQNVN